MERMAFASRACLCEKATLGGGRLSVSSDESAESSLGDISAEGISVFGHLSLCMLLGER